MKIAVIGAGLFGITAALELDRAGHEVTLFEKNSQILQAASGINQYRLHRGYHYPRSPETIKSCLDAEESFREMYQEALIDDFDQHYAIARSDSKTSAEQFMAVCDRFGLVCREASPRVVNSRMTEKIFLVEESLVDPLKLLQFCRQKLNSSGVRLCLNRPVFADGLDDFDHIVVATYARLNESLGRHNARTIYQFEVCEKPILKLPASFTDVSVVALDGPFMCIDPYGKTGYHVMGNVVHAIHAANVGEFPIVPPELASLLDRGVIKNPPLTAFSKFIQAAAAFFPGIEEAEHIGSMYTIRTVLPNTDATDTRPTLVRRVDDRITSVFSGKLISCVLSAREIVNLLTRQ